MRTSPTVERALELYRLYYLEGQRQPSYLAELYRLIEGFELTETDQYYRWVRPMVLQVEVQTPVAPVAPAADRRPPYRLVVPDPTPR